MTKKKRKVVGRFDKLVANQDLLNWRILKPVFLAPSVLVVVLLEVPRGVVVLLGGEDRLWEEGQDPVARRLMSQAGCLPGCSFHS